MPTPADLDSDTHRKDGAASAGEATVSDDAIVDDDRLSALARRVGSDESIAWLKRIAMAAALAFLVGAVGYLIGVRSTERPGNAVDAGFLQDMTDHHDQAVTMAQYELAHGTDDVTKKFAMEVILFQRQEIGRMQNFEDDLRVKDDDYSPDRQTMGWMGMPTPLKDMPGMANDDQLTRLEAARGADADKLFLTLMAAHHIGGVHMADYEAQHGANPAIRAMAGRMASNQRTEVKEYQAVLNRLNGNN